MKMRIEFAMDNAAFEGDKDDEIQGVLDNVVLQVKNLIRPDGKCMDSNGNTIGQWTIEE